MSTAAAASTTQIDLDSMSLEQLNQIKQSEENRLQAVVQHFSTLRASANRMQSSLLALSKITPSSEDQEIMVPLTESLYVPGKLKDPSKVMVELGTGYYVEKNMKQAVEFIERKNRLVDANSENIMEVIAVSKRNIQSVNDAMNGKMLQIRAKAEAQKIQAKEAGN